MEKGKGSPPAKNKARTRSGSESGTRPKTGMTSTTKNLQEEATKMATLASNASAKAQTQRKMTEFVQAAQGGAGELPPGPRGPAAQAVTPASVQEVTEKVAMTLSQMREEASAVQTLQQTASTSATPTPSTSAAKTAEQEEIMVIDDDEDGGGWQTWTNRRRKIGADLGEQDRRQSRGSTPFQLPGQPHHDRRGYYTSAYLRNTANADQYRSSKHRAAAALTREQWEWFHQGACLGCGKNHQVKDCRAITREEGRAMLRAALSCPEDMRPGARAAAGTRPKMTRRNPTAAQGRSAGTPAAQGRGAGTPAGPPTPATATKRSREGESSSGLTPEAKKARQFSDAVKSSLILFVREKDGSALSRDRYLALKSSFAYFVEDMMAKNRDPPICAGRWVESRSVVKIPMASEEDVLWMRSFLEKSYLVQSEEDFNKSKGKIYVTYLKDKLEPEFTNMRMDKLANFVRFYKRATKIDGLFEIKMAAKTPKGKAVHLIMDEQAEKVFVQQGCKIPFAGAGWISFEDRATYVARIKAQERERLKPKPSALQQGLEIQKIGVDLIQLDDEEEEGQKQKEPAEGEGGEKSKETAKSFGRQLWQEIKQGMISAEAAKAKMLEKTGMDLDEVKEPHGRTESASSWSEEVEHMRSLEKAGDGLAAVAEEKEDEVDELAQFELSREQDAQISGDHRAAGSGQPAEGAASSPSDSHT